MHKILDALRSNREDILDKYDDLYLNLSKRVEGSYSTNRLLTMCQQLRTAELAADTSIPKIKQREEAHTVSMSAGQLAVEVMSCTAGLPEELA
jgi:hypothetical protein